MSSDHPEPAPPLIPPPPAPPWRLWLLALTAGLAAGLVSWRGGETAVDFFVPEMHDVPLMGTTVRQAIPASAAVTEVKNSALAFAILGGVLGLSLGLAGGLARGCLRAALKASAVGLVAGAAVGPLAALALVPVYQRAHNPLSHSLLIPLLYHSGLWGAVGAAGGLALGVGLGGGWRTAARCAVGGLVGGVLGTAVFELIGAATFPFDKTHQPLSTSAQSRFVARLAVALCVALGAVIATQVSERKPVSRS